MTEFVIVIPIILLLFFAMLQYFAIVQASQLANYAAFVSARVYAVRASVDSTNAQNDAVLAASMVMAPVANPVPGEIPLLGSALNTGTSTLSQYLPGATKYFEGLAFAYFLRFRVLGGSVSNSVNGSQVDCAINYPQPIFMPGLREMWNFISKDKTKTVNTDTASLEAGLGGLIKDQAEVVNLQNEANSAVTEFNSLLGTSLSLPQINLQYLLPYVNVQAKCSLGYSGWSGSPRLPDDTTDTSGTDTNLAGLQGLIKQTQQDQNSYSNACQAAQQKCLAISNACAKVQQDKQIIANNSPPQNTVQSNLVAQYTAKLNNTDQPAYSAAQSAYPPTKANVKSTADAVNADNAKMRDFMTQHNQDPSNIKDVPEDIDCKDCYGTSY